MRFGAALPDNELQLVPLETTMAEPKTHRHRCGRPMRVVAAPPGAQILVQGSASYPVHDLVGHCSPTRSDSMAAETFGVWIAEILRLAPNQKTCAAMPGPSY